MKSLLLTCVLIAAPAAAADAQGLGYGIGGVSGISGFFGPLTGFDAAGGGEVLINGVGGVGAEAGALVIGSSMLGRVSVNGVVHLVPRPFAKRASPFVTSGWTRMGNGEGSFDAWNVGAGADLWAKPCAGFRIEFRDHIRPDDRGTVHYWTIRAGVAFR